MKTSITAILTLQAFLCQTSIAAPPSTSYPQVRHQQQPIQSGGFASRWRTLSDHFVGALFDSGKTNSIKSSPSATQPDRSPPSHTHGKYGGDLVLRFNISNAEEASSLADAADKLLLDVWEFSHNWVDIRLAKDTVPSLLKQLPPSLQSSHTLLMRELDLVQAIQNTYPAPRGQESPQRHRPMTPPSPNRGFSPSLEQATGADTNIFFSDYQPLSVIEPWMRLLSSLFTTHVRHISIGESFEGRRIPAIRIGVHPTNNEDPHREKRKTILVVGGSHAREWIGTTTVNYVAYSLITGYGKLQSITKLLQDFDFVFIPTLNPDGYVYTWETDRLWRKNRQVTQYRFCRGIDLDHSFGYKWEASSNPCSESYGGETPLEAVEAQRLSEWARNETENNNVEFVGFLDLHSYSQEILYPYSYTCGATPPGLENLEELAAGLSKAIRISLGHNYEILPACEGNVVQSGEKKEHLHPRMEASGGSLLDFFYGSLNVHYSYQLKLRDRGTYGFLLPKEHIIPTGKEILNAVLYLAAFLGDTYSEDAAEVRLTRPVLDDEDEAASPNGDRPSSAPMADILDEVEEESVPGWAYSEVVGQDIDPASVRWDLKRRR